MKLELKHLATYLPYGLKFRTTKGQFKYGEYHILIMNGLSIDIDQNPNIEFLHNSDLKFSSELRPIKPILRPLSEFGDSDNIRQVHEFIGLGGWCEYYDNYFDAWFNDSCSIDKLILQAPQEIFNYFLANHFDVFGLIPAGLAIDINTI